MFYKCMYNRFTSIELFSKSVYKSKYLCISDSWDDLRAGRQHSTVWHVRLGNLSTLMSDNNPLNEILL